MSYDAMINVWLFQKQCKNIVSKSSVICQTMACLE